MQKTALIVVIAAGILIILFAVVLFLVRQAALLPEAGPVIEPGDAVEELTEGTTISDIEKDLDLLLQEQRLLGDVEAELKPIEQELESEGL